MDYKKLTVFLLRISTGWLMFYAGITKVINPEWSAAGYLNHAKTFPDFFAWFASPEILPITNFVNEWGLTLLGVSLIIGAFIRLSSILGAALMLLYYFPAFDFPYVEHGYLVDDHIIYALLLVMFAAWQAGRTWGLDAKLAISKAYKKNKKLGAWLG